MQKIFIILLISISYVSSFSQTISGRVFDEAGEPISLANVIIDGTDKGTTASSDGTFLIEAKTAGITTIVVSHVGYITNKKTIITETNSNYVLDFVLIKDLVAVQEVIIKANSKSHTETINIPARIKSLESTDIQLIPSTSTTNLLSRVSGINVDSEFGMFSSASVTLRGIGGSSQTGTLIVLDGMPLNKSDGGSVNWNIIDKDNIQKIEVFKGPGSALFGSNAMGGIINIFTKTPDKNLNADLSASYGTYNTLELKSNISGLSSNNGFYYKTFIQYQTSDGYINTPDEIILENDSIVVPVFLKDFFIGGLIGYNIDNINSIEFSINYYNDIRGRGTKIFEDIGSNTERNTAQSFLKYKGRIGQWRSYANIYALNENYFRLNEFFSDGEYKLYEVDSKRKDYGLRIWSEKNIFKNGEITIGGEARKGSVDAADLYYTSTDLITNKGMLDIYAMFIQYKHLFRNQKWMIVAGLRYDLAYFHDAAFAIEKPSYSIEYFSNFQFDNIDNKTWDSFNPKFTLQYLPSVSSRIYFTIAKGFRAPILDDLCRTERSRRGLRIANPELKPEHIYNAETGFDKTFYNLVKTELSAYYNKEFDFMYMLSTGDSVNLGYTIAPVYHIANISNVDIYGVEFDISAPLGNHLKAWMNYSYNKATISQFTARTDADLDLNGKFLINTPMHSSSAGFNVLTRLVNLSVAYKYTGSRWVKEDNTIDNIYLMTDKYPAYYTIDIKLWKQLGNLNLSLNIDNIMNEIYINSRGYKSPGRMIFLNANYFIIK
jgi:outer membrane receptor protein involved in Fe transport